MKKILLLFVFLLIMTGGVIIAQNYLNEGQISIFKKTPTVTIGDYSFEVRVADSPEERETGLSETQSLAENQGMIFLFEKPDYYRFWMKNMKIPIDIVYINADEIVAIEENAQPLKDRESPIIYTPTELTDRVLEINAGLAEKYGFKKGNKVQANL